MLTVLKRPHFILGSLIVLSLFIPHSGFAGRDKTTSFHEITRWKLGGDGGWDYVKADSDSRRLYIARNNRVMVVDLDSGKLIGEVPDTEGAHGIALVPELSLGFATAGRAGSISAFDLKTLKKTGEIRAGENPDAIIYDQASKNIFAFNGKSKNVTVVDPKTKTVVKTIPLSGKPEFAVSNESGYIYLNIEDQSKIAVIDVKSLQVKNQYPLAPCEAPTGLSIDSSKDRLYVGCGNKMAAVVDGSTGKIIKTIKSGEGIDATAFDPKMGLAFVSAGEGLLTVINGESNEPSVIQNLKSQKGARTMAVDSAKGHILLATAQFGPFEKPAPDQKHGRPAIISDSFVVIVIGQ